MDNNEHDYKAAIEWVEEQELLASDRGVFNVPVYATLLHALSLAEKVTGEPSEEMKAEGARYGLNSIVTTWPNLAAGYFKAMIAQAQKEIEDGQ